MKFNAKNCFDRFGDDLTELILQYLTFEDKVRLECVSKQWRRLVYNQQFVIELSMSNTYQQTNDSLRILYLRRDMASDNRKALKSLLKKCPNIKTIRINRGVYSSVLTLIGRYCPRINSLTYYPSIDSDDNVLSFFRMYGHKLEELDIHENLGNINEEMKQILEFSLNVKSIKLINYCPNLISYFDNDINILPKLEHIKSPLIISSKDLKLLKILSDKYNQTMKTLNVCPGIIRAEKDIKTFFECISQFENLKELELSINFIPTTQPIDDCLSLIGQKCNKLLKLDLSIEEEVSISNGFFKIFSEFKTIKRLKIVISPEIVLSGSVECFKHCKQLIDLDITYPGLREDFFANIASFVPKLQSLIISTDKKFSDSFINSIHSIENIQTVDHLFKDSTAKSMIWYFGKSLSQEMSGPDRMNVKPITRNCGLIKYIINFDYNDILRCVFREYIIAK